MSIKLKYKENEFNVDTLIWDRDSFFIDFNEYWSRVVGLLAQKVAENTTNNWNSFNLIRNQAIKILGFDAEANTYPSSPINILPTNLFSVILVAGLQLQLRDKTREELNELFQSLARKTLDETQIYIKNAIIKENIELIKQINKKTKQIIITNDSKGNNAFFLQESGIENFIHQTQAETNKEQIDNLLKNNSIFLTKNNYLKSFYNKKNLNNILIVDEINLINFSYINDSITIFIDGASRGNPGKASIGIAFYKDKELIHEVSEFIGEGTNNFAEYTSLIKALEISIEKGYKNIEIKSDSELIVKQIKKIYKVKDVYMKELYDKASLLIEKVNSFQITHVPREENLMADKLANKALQQH